MIDPLVDNLFGLTQSEANLVGPGRRPLSSMTPTLVFDATGRDVVGCVGGSGGPRIISNTLDAVIDAWFFDLDAYTAIAGPRVHHQWSPDTLRVDPWLAPDVRAALEARGHVLQDLTSPTAVQLIKVLPGGVVEAASDPRKGGLPAAP
jgi:gamma-glutamyltranspeptidase